MKLVSWRRRPPGTFGTVPRDPVKPMRLGLARPHPSGILAQLPLEIQHMILDQMDLPSIANFAQASVYSRITVRSLPSYTELVRHAPKALSALIPTHTASLCSMAQLREALRSDRCAGCLEYGAYLFLPTCTRCCMECLFFNPSFRLVTLRDAKGYFALGEKSVRQLPIVRSLRVDSYVFDLSAPPGPVQLVSAAMAKELGIRIHGSAQELRHAMGRRFKKPWRIARGEFLQRATTGPGVLQGDPLLGPRQADRGHEYKDAAAVEFPSLGKSRIADKGTWCKGCDATAVWFRKRRLDQATVSAMVPPGANALRFLVGLSFRARSKADHLEHVKHCYGAQKLLAGVTYKATDEFVHYRGLPYYPEDW